MRVSSSRLKTFAQQRALVGALLGGVCGALFALLTLAPARWVSEAVRVLSHEQVLLLNPKGSVWTGSAQLALSAGAQSQGALGLPTRLEWQLRPYWLQAQEARASSLGALFWNDPLSGSLLLKSECCFGPDFILKLKPQSLGVLITLPPTSVQLPAQWLEGLGAPWNTLQPKGQLSLQSHDFEMLFQNASSELHGALELKIENLSSRLSTVKPLGSYRVLFNSQSSPQIELSSVAQSRLLLSGRGQWARGRLHFEGLAETTASDEDTLSNLLNVLGQRTGHQAQLRMD